MRIPKRHTETSRGSGYHFTILTEVMVSWVCMSKPIKLYILNMCHLLCELYFNKADFYNYLYSRSRLLHFLIPLLGPEV